LQTTLPTLPLCFISCLAPLECSSSYAKYYTKLWKINVHICIQEMHTISKQICSCTLWWCLFCALSQSVQLTFILNCIQRSWGAWRCAHLLQHGNLINSALCLLEDLLKTRHSRPDVRDFFLGTASPNLNLSKRLIWSTCSISTMWLEIRQIWSR
jgi:hypothetical protein